MLTGIEMKLNDTTEVVKCNNKLVKIYMNQLNNKCFQSFNASKMRILAFLLT